MLFRSAKALARRKVGKPASLREAKSKSLGHPQAAAGDRRGTQEGAARQYVLETGLYADLALVKAHRADAFGNLVYRKTARNFNPMMASAAAFVIAEVEEIVGTGEIDGDEIHTPGSYVDRIVRTVPVKRIEQRTVTK